jgi:GGDEF domain-containing protein
MGADTTAVADYDFLRIFMPREIRLAQRQAMLQSARSSGGEPRSCLGIYLVRLEPIEGDWFPAPAEGGSQIGDHIQEILAEVIRDSDLPARLSDQEHLAILRNLDPEQTHTVSQRFLSAATESSLLHAANLRARVGYIIYPLSSQPNHPPQQWETIIELARVMSRYGDPSGRASGSGLLRGPSMTEDGIPESDLIPLAIRDPDGLVKVGMLQIQKIHLMPSV